MILMLFGSSQKTISRGEFQEALSTLYSKGFTDRERDQIRSAFRGDLDESGSQEGIDEIELTRAMDWLRSNMSVHNISSAKLDTLESVLKSKF